ncbi:hypothetical protein P153DRAFT_390849 [Dothidotthia symphoricarpi CBS 119687]|uniref:SRR1-like domain-containing protein n=1 Tax=Dothidotthia symphoricarpi CBS 119687 TaxID=1392245 RepID=A0A6A5ZXN9_9PLEO|nr:uncharacterized protein P153DRAFT_390849 [Dothidotthia symphoricarpi CBS 119687]KAF2124299.1 hypothetical protein P153DRAFT_390849 [Dothidotthia symphoricarpi CBS 119687]
MRGRRRVKRQQVEADDGWTTITHGLSNLSVGKGKEVSKEYMNSFMPTRTVEGLTSEKLLEDFKKLEDRWTETTCAKQIKAILDRREWDIGVAVCIGIGSFSLDWHHRHRSLWQLVLFMDVVGHLKEQNPSLTLYAQEPTFTPVDIAFLKSLAVTVVESAVESHISPQTFVYAPFVDWCILLPVFLKDKKPALYVGNEIQDDYTAVTQGKKGSLEKLDESNEVGKKFLQEREMARLEEFDMHLNALSGLCIYWNKEGEEEDDAQSREDS